MSCSCRCHVYGPGANVTCDVGPVQPGGIRYCGPCEGYPAAGPERDVELRNHPVGYPRQGTSENTPENRSEPFEDMPIEERCVLPHDEPAKRYIGMLCGRDYHRILNRLREIEELFALRDEAILPGPGSDGRHATRFGSPAPGRIELMEITDRRMTIADDIPDLPGVLASWARMVCEELDLDDELTGDVSQSVRILRREHKWISAQAWVDDYDAELHHLHRAIAHGVGASMWPESIGACPNCGAKLYPTLGVDAVTCRRCTAQWTGVDLARLRLIHEQEAK